MSQRTRVNITIHNSGNSPALIKSSTMFVIPGRIPQAVDLAPVDEGGDALGPGLTKTYGFHTVSGTDLSSVTEAFLFCKIEYEDVISTEPAANRHTSSNLWIWTSTDWVLRQAPRVPAGDLPHRVFT